RIVTLNRPGEMNAFSAELHVAFARVWERIDDDEHCRAVVVTGAGRAFSAGGRYDDFERRRVDHEFRRAELREARRLVEAM
ncbi:enoyl-CoA hydratase/isomerase family protein, partial [Acinetobacter baumannii]